jgi:hypothetical protein
MTSAARSGIRGLAQWLPSKVSGGARSADEVIAQITISAINQTCAPLPTPATNGRATNAAHETAVNKPTNRPSRPTNGAILSAATPITVSVTVKIAWSIIRIRITADGAIPTSAASFGR